MPNLECHICGSTDRVEMVDWNGTVVPMCYECQCDFGVNGRVARFTDK